ncbi:hypothetical protein LOTGIDRAFT_233247 [Lottia gigantea]|uniref:Globin n=1 Tax=Lottia gigantea TaxID=225164 RepID=V4A5G6_LOTGI|nr:hypothetical protein LOTGIDRAFT_233247 [Lottia gigantea]ESO91927.1 hypothetical protein LOTGIDRAFT_233247 [Lottia gigantea]
MSADNMGCGSSSGVSTGMPADLTEKDKELVKSSWAKFNEGDVIADGAHIYYKLFEKAPEAKEKFGFAKDGEVSLENKQFKAHVRKVLDVFESVVREIDQLEGLLPVLNDLGARHKSYGVPLKYYEILGSCIMYAWDRKLKMDADTKKAWGKLYGVVQTEMKKGNA